MNGGYTNVLASSRVRLLFGNLATGGGELRFKDINWTTPHVRQVQRLVIAGSTQKDLHRGNATGGIWGIIVEMGSVRDSEGPERFIIGFGPMERGMDHHGVSEKQQFGWCLWRHHSAI